MKLGAWLVAMVQPLLAKVLLALGFSVVSITGMQAILTTLKDQALSGFSFLSPETLNLFLIAGGGQGLGIIFGACTTKLLLWQIENGTKILGVNPT